MLLCNSSCSSFPIKIQNVSQLVHLKFQMKQATSQSALFSMRQLYESLMIGVIHETLIIEVIGSLTQDFKFSGPVLEIVNSSTGLVYSTGSYLSIECVYLNTSRAQVQTTTQHPLFPLDQRIPLKHDVLNWKFNNRTFSLQNRKRYQTKLLIN